MKPDIQDLLSKSNDLLNDLQNPPTDEEKLLDTLQDQVIKLANIQKLLIQQVRELSDDSELDNLIDNNSDIFSIPNVRR